VAADRGGRALVDVVAAAKKAGLEISGRDVLKSAPRGYPKDHPRIDLLRYKGLITWREWPAGAWLGTAKAKARVVEFLTASGPMNDWLRKNVGSSAMLEGRP
jgi:uncharacterized protein (DUF2461 family)